MLRRGSLPAVPWWVPASVPVPVVFELATESAEEGMGDFYRDRKGLKAAAAPSPAAAAQAPGGGEDRDLSPAASGAGGVLRDVSVSVAVAAEMCCGYQVTLEWSEFSMEASSTVCSKSVSARKDVSLGVISTSPSRLAGKQSCLLVAPNLECPTTFSLNQQRTKRWQETQRGSRPGSGDLCTVVSRSVVGTGADVETIHMAAGAAVGAPKATAWSVRLTASFSLLTHKNNCEHRFFHFQAQSPGFSA
ncbi:uncharacterized protein LOC128917536 isoform X2 [Rissa tridactyla]|uniref:uncharacterized protein LOC128917536 isoform X2 n=1 Tax=Rissa tridactyla TaxID=75485 RepID=UPI0023BB1B26|nr:uncharacterized protein LOC128917536 isoform X2 [Rissa tridactyla]